MVKKYPSREDIAEMRVRGYDSTTIQEALEGVKRGDEVNRLKAQINDAFAGVKLGSGIGLYEAQALDGYADCATQALQRERDEREDWRAISAEQLNECNSSLSFFDAEGMRFHLPAYLIADLDGAYKFGMDFCLTHCPDHRFALLNPRQAEAISQFLRFIENEPDYSMSRDHIRHAIDQYWVA
ncbi:MAG: hypothetical protein LBV44_00040 [Methylobacillus sp.]|jgi:hypothetical protein|nr:hypothetical protein [Methylobacillus sp.]